MLIRIFADCSVNLIKNMDVAGVILLVQENNTANNSKEA